MGSAGALGVVRFAYALLFLATHTDLGWSFANANANAGTMNTADAADYLVGALAVLSLGKQCGDRPVVMISLLSALRISLATVFKQHTTPCMLSSP
jgi:hypothetical protein